ncbi:hypothetical protein QTP86_030878, partial [Hemibagrus guttatus]
MSCQEYYNSRTEEETWEFGARRVFEADMALKQRGFSLTTLDPRWIVWLKLNEFRNESSWLYSKIRCKLLTCKNAKQCKLDVKTRSRHDHKAAGDTPGAG